MNKIDKMNNQVNNEINEDKLKLINIMFENFFINKKNIEFLVKNIINLDKIINKELDFYINEENYKLREKLKKQIYDNLKKISLCLLCKDININEEKKEYEKFYDNFNEKTELFIYDIIKDNNEYFSNIKKKRRKNKIEILNDNIFNEKYILWKDLKEDKNFMFKNINKNISRNDFIYILYLINLFIFKNIYKSLICLNFSYFENKIIILNNSSDIGYIELINKNVSINIEKLSSFGFDLNDINLIYLFIRDFYHNVLKKIIT